MTAKPQRKVADDLDRSIAKSVARDPEYRELLRMAVARRQFLRKLAAERERRRIPQQRVARAMGTSQPAVARIEAGASDLRLSTMERYASAVGRPISYQFTRAKRTRIAS